MNKEYIYLDGKVIISDENNKKILMNIDNLDKVLSQENLIETMENRIQELEKESALYKKNNRKHYVPVFLPLSVLLSTIGTAIATYYIIGPNAFTTSVDTIFGEMSVAMSFCIPTFICLIPAGAFFEYMMHSDYKSSIKYEKEINSQLSYLKEQIVKEREKLERLKQDKSRDKEATEFRTVKVDDSQQLKSLSENLNNYFDLGYNNKTQDEDREEKGHSLVLRKKNRNTNSSNNSQK